MKRLISLLAAALTLLLLVVPSAAQALQKNPFSVRALPAQLQVGQPGSATVTLVVPPDTYLYRDMAELVVLNAGGLTVGALTLPPGELKFDSALGAEREVWEFDAQLELPVTASKPGTFELLLEARYQGCKQGICFLPVAEQVVVPVSVTAKGAGLMLPGLLGGVAHAATLTDDNPVAVTVGVEGMDIRVDFEQKEGWHLTQMMTFLEVTEGQAVALGEQRWPDAHERPDPAIEGATRGEYDGNFSAYGAVLGPAGDHQVKGVVGYQACKAALCLLPQYVDFDLAMTLDGSRPSGEAPVEVPTDDVAEAVAGGSAVAAAPPAAGSFGGGDGFSKAREKGIVPLLAFVFAAGFLVSLTPCVLPMVPITIGIIGARSSGSRAQAFSLALTYVAGLAAVYTGLGVFAALSGSIFGGWMQSPSIVGTVALFFVAMGFSMFGFFEVGVPSSIAVKLNEKGGAGYGGAFVVGAVGAIVAGPCSGPVIASLMVLIGQQGELALGVLLMLAFSLGMGVIFLVAGTFSGNVLRPGAWMDTIKKSFGVVMWLGAIYFVDPHLPDWVTALLTAGVLLSTAVFGWPSADEGDGMEVRARRLYGVVGGIVGAYLLLGLLLTKGFILPPMQLASAGGVVSAQGTAMAWLDNEPEALALAKAQGKPVVLDFTADWCAACKELEHFTYSHPDVIARSAGFVSVMIDATSDKDPEIQRLFDKYKVTGLPTVVFMAPDGSVHADLTLTGFEKADAFLPRMQAALDRQ